MVAQGAKRVFESEKWLGKFHLKKIAFFTLENTFFRDFRGTKRSAVATRAAISISTFFHLVPFFHLAP
jgi:hypothetical protein